MKTRRRVLVFARHYWPAINDDTLRLYDWIEQLRRQGAEVTVATPKWHSTWPQQVVCNGVAVHRIDFAPTHSLRNGRYLRQLTLWMSRVAGDADLIYCDAPDLEAAAVLSYVSEVQPIPLVVRYDARHPAGPLPPGTELSGKPLEICRRASRVIAPSPLAQQQLLAAGVERRSILRASQGYGRCYDRNPDARRRARQVLSEANRDLFVRGHDRVVVCPGELSQRWGVVELIKALAPLIEEHRSLQVWVLGDSRERVAIYEALRHDGLHRLVAMPGIFTDLEEVLQAADLCLFPAPDLGQGWLIPTCINSAIPLLVNDCPQARYLLKAHADELTFTIAHPASLREQISKWLKNPSLLTATVMRARQNLRSSLEPCLGCDELFQFMETSA